MARARSIVSTTRHALLLRLNLRLCSRSCVCDRVDDPTKKHPNVSPTQTKQWSRTHCCVGDRKILLQSNWRQKHTKLVSQELNRSVSCVSLLKPTTARAEPRQTKIMVHWLYSGGDQASKRGYNGQRGGCRLDEDLMFFALGKKRKHRVHIHDSIGKTVSVHVKLFKCPRVHRTATRDKKRNGNIIPTKACHQNQVPATRSNVPTFSRA